MDAYWTGTRLCSAFIIRSCIKIGRLSFFQGQMAGYASLMAKRTVMARRLGCQTVKLKLLEVLFLREDIYGLYILGQNHLRARCCLRDPQGVRRSFLNSNFDSCILMAHNDTSAHTRLKASWLAVSYTHPHQSCIMLYSL